MDQLQYYPGCRTSCFTEFHQMEQVEDVTNFVCFNCKGSHLEGKSSSYLYCSVCKLQYYYDCHRFIPEILHPFHLSHPLTLICQKPRDRFSFESLFGYYSSIPKRIKRICNCCWKDIIGHYYYHCSVCNYSIDSMCADEPLNRTITHPKSHEHTLTLFPGRLPLPCKACGVPIDNVSNGLAYTCLPCSYMVHQTCIYLPRVIKLTRHPHRLSFSPFFRSGEISCGVCHQQVNNHYGQYSCSDGCLYVIHSKCATREDVWDGRDLEGVPEEPEEIIEPFVKIDEETIHHFTHEHYLKLNGNGNRSENPNKFCEACTLALLISDTFYSCMECDFVLHEACACLPRKKHHPLHKHPLFLQKRLPRVSKFNLFASDSRTNLFSCNGCERDGCGFVYICTEKECGSHHETWKFQLDTRCASLTDFSIHGFHIPDHPLYIHRVHGGTCKCCNAEISQTYALECMPCKSTLCLGCATFPQVAHYKYDRHMLVLSYGEQEKTVGQYWCEICESKLDASTRFYTCDFCRVTVHVRCLLEEIYMKPNHIFTWNDKEIETALNDGTSRPSCGHCARRCVEPLVFKRQDQMFCSFKCIKTMECDSD